MWQNKVVIKCSGHIFSDRNGQLDVLSPLNGASLLRPVSVYRDGYKEYYEILCLDRRYYEVITFGGTLANLVV